MSTKMILILGVTASGKGRLAFELAQRLGGEIVSIDSMKVYRRMDIGTAKPSAEARGRVQHHMIDVVEPSESFSVGLFHERARAAIEDMRSRGKPVVAVGGTALYIKALLYGLFEGPGSDEEVRAELRARAASEGWAVLHKELAGIDPDAADRISANDAKRIIRALEVYQLTGKPISSFQKQFDAEETPQEWLIIGLRREKALESRRINARVKKMVEMGLVEEVRSLLAEERPLSRQARSAIGYAEIIGHLQGRMPLEETVEQIKKNTRRLAKGQRTWFKTFRQVHWIDVEAEESFESVLARAEKRLGYTICSSSSARSIEAASPRTSCLIRLRGMIVTSMRKIRSSTIEATVRAVWRWTPNRVVRSWTIRVLSQGARSGGCLARHSFSASANSFISIARTSVRARLSRRARACLLRAKAAFSYPVATRTALIIEKTSFELTVRRPCLL